MEFLYLVLLVITSYSLFWFILNNKKIRHASMVAKLTPVRTMTLEEHKRFNSVYKQKIEKAPSVYSIHGNLEYSEIEVNQSQIREYSIEGVLIHTHSVKRLEMKDVGIKMEGYLPDEEKLDEVISELTKKLEAGLFSHDQVEELILLDDKQYFHTFEFAFLNDNVQKESAYIVAIGDWKL